MSLQLAALTLAILGISAVRSEINNGKQCWSGGNGQSAKFWDEGARIDRGKYWYECRNGELVPMGCFDGKGQRIPALGTYTSNGYVVECALDERGYLSFKYVGCSDGVRTYSPGDTWEDPERMYWFECQQDGPSLVKVQVGGCVAHDKSRHLAVGERYDFGEYTYECQRKYNGSVQMCSVGCLNGGAHYKVGEQWTEGDFVFYCKLNGGRCQKICVGCQYRNKRLYNGDRYHKDQMVYQCEVRSDKYGHKPVGCVVQEPDGSSIERVIGYHTTGESKVEQTCELDGDKTRVKTLGCIFVYKGYDTLFLYPGTYTVWTQSLDHQPIGVSCHEAAPGASPKLESFDLMDIAARTQGLKYDKPRG